uniref:Swap70 protein n=1 Tax=Eptatretus burgeri TaxID=7764 RepID=B6ZDR9_EPTBU|nr:Swap70 [Eptatretus burgeri]
MPELNELLKPIWHAFSALHVDKYGKASKSQLKVLSHNLCTVLRVPHDPVSLEEHFRDDDSGPVSSKGYMPYLRTYILDKVQDVMFDKEQFEDLCWMIASKKNYPQKQGCFAAQDAFKMWSLFNFLSEDQYPLVICFEEVDYLLRRLCGTLALRWKPESLKTQMVEGQEGLSAWQFLSFASSILLQSDVDKASLTMAIDDIYQELVLEVIKKGCLWKRSSRLKVCTELWFVLRRNSLFYYANADIKEHREEIPLHKGGSIELLPDREGRRCFFALHCPEKTLELGAEDVRRRQEWVAAIQTVVRFQQQGRRSQAWESRAERRIERQREQTRLQELAWMDQALQANETNRQMEVNRLQKEYDLAESRRLQDHMELQQQFQQELEKEKQARAGIEAKMAQQAEDTVFYQQRIRELENIYEELRSARAAEQQAVKEEELAHLQQNKIMAEEMSRRKELEQQRDVRVLSHSSPNNDGRIQRMHIVSERLQELQQEKLQVKENYQRARQHLERAQGNTQSWKQRVSEKERQIGLLRPIQPGDHSSTVMSHRGSSCPRPYWRRQDSHTPEEDTVDRLQHGIAHMAT